MKQNIELNRLLTNYDGHVPRYTSYPPANYMLETRYPFNFIKNLMHLSTDEPVSLYVHIPFCHSLCYYCGCNTKIVKTQKPIERYMQDLSREIDLVTRYILSHPPVGQVHFGGGSPNYPEPKALRKVLRVLKKQFTFSDSTEIHMECDPRLLTDEKIEAYVKMGVSRFSLGVQDFDPNVQEAINRIQPPELLQKQMEKFESLGVGNINFDLIIGLPKQTLQTVDSTLEETVRMNPSRIAVFPYAHVPWMKKHQKVLEQYNLPDSAERFEMTELVGRKLREAGYISIGMDHYAKKDDSLAVATQKGKLRRNFQGYTDDTCQTLLGFGLSAISQFPDSIFQNHSELKDYRNSIERARVPVKKELSVEKGDLQIKHLIETLLCSFRLPKDLFVSAPFVNRHRLEEMEKDELVYFPSDGGLEITDKGRPFARIVAACFDPRQQKLTNKEKAHARAV